MAFDCPICATANDDRALVCNSCARDIVVPVSLIAERDDLIRKLNVVREELTRAKAELEGFRTKGRTSAKAAAT